MVRDRIECQEDLLSIVEETGFLPLFRGEIAGFSVEDLCDPALWFQDDVDGPWEWKGPIARSKRCMYGKFFGGKAGFVAAEWVPDFVNYRRNGYDFDARCDEGLAPKRDAYLYETVAAEGTLLSKRLKQLCNYRKGGNTGFDTVITRLQMQTYVCIADFVYERDRHGKPYGWGVAEYTTPEFLFGDRAAAAYRRRPEDSAERILEHLRKTTEAPMSAIERLIRWPAGERTE